MTARPGLPRFSGPFQSFSVSASTNRETGTDCRLLVYSQGSRAKVVRYLWLKYLWDELSLLEMELFLTLPEITNSEIGIATLRAVLLQGKVKTRRNLNSILLLLGKETFLRKQYQGFKRLDVEIQRITRSLPRVPKFSGWVKSIAAIGKNRPGGPSFLEPLAIIENDYEDNVFDWYHYLTVGELEILDSQWTLSHPDEV